MSPRLRALPFFLFTLLACGGAGPPPDADVDEASITSRGVLEPQSLLHDKVDDRHKQIAWSFQGKAGDVVSPDVWPTPSTASRNELHPVLTLLGPARNGKRPLLARGTPRNEDERHIAIDAFKLPKAGTYLVSVAQAADGRGGELSLRFWTSASHAPRPERAQVDLKLRPTEEMSRLIADRRPGGVHEGQAWTDEQVDAAISLYAGNADFLAAVSDAEQLLMQLWLDERDARATEAQLHHARQAAAALVGRSPAFASLPAEQQAFAIYWLGDLTGLLFRVAQVPASAAGVPLRNVAAQIDALQASWKGSVPYRERNVREISLGGIAYGYVADWASVLTERDGTPVFVWWSTDYFDKNGRWLGEQSNGATEPDED
jgi:hypothetical protein